MLTILLNLIVALLLFALGSGTVEILGAPGWTLGLALIPCLAFLVWRRWISWRFAGWFVIVFALSGIVFAILMPKELQHFSGGLAVLLLTAFVRPTPPGNKVA